MQWQSNRVHARETLMELLIVFVQKSRFFRISTMYTFSIQKFCIIPCTEGATTRDHYEIRPRASPSVCHWVTSWIFKSNRASANHYNVLVSNGLFMCFVASFRWRIEWNSTSVYIGRPICNNSHFVSIFILVKADLTMSVQNTGPLK